MKCYCHRPTTSPPSSSEKMEVTSALRCLTTLAICILFPLLLVYLRFSPKPTSKTSATSDACPSSGQPIIGNLIGFLKNRHRFLDWATGMLSASPSNTIPVRGFLDLSRGVCTANPANVEHLLKSNFPNYVKGDRYRSVLSDLLGDGIFNSDADLWSLQRKIASREFTTRSLKSFVVDIVQAEIQGSLIPFLSDASDAGDTVDIQDVLRRFAFDNICNLAFGIDPACLDPNGKPPRFVEAFDEAVKISADRFFSPFPWVWKLKRILNVGSERRLRDAIDLIDEYAMEIISSRQQEKEKVGRQRLDLLSRFMACLDGDDELGSIFRDEKEKKKFLRDIVVSFILAGKDSTSTALTWFFWLLTRNPHCEQKIFAEISEFEDQQFKYDDAKQLHYLHAAVSEALRLYPPVPINSRLTAADDVLPDGTPVEAGWFADYSAYAMARMERVWGEDCEKFVPERWLDEKGKFVAVDSYRFPVFHAGPRTCLGREMAYVQMKSVAAAVLRRFQVEVVGRQGCTETPPLYELSLTLKMKGGFPVRLKRRNENV